MHRYGTIFKNMGQARQPLFVYFRPFLSTMTNVVQNLTVKGKSVDGMLGIRTRDFKMVGAAESTELWRPSMLAQFLK